MARLLPRKSRVMGESALDETPESFYSLDIRIDERAGRLRIYDPRAFQDGRRSFCRHLLEAVAEHPALSKAEVDLASASCRLEFEPGAIDATTMAELATAAIRRAAAERPVGDRPRWWSLSARWTSLTAYRAPEGLSWWEAHEARPGRVHLRHDSLLGDREALDRVATALADLDGIDGSRASSWTRTLTLDYRLDSPVADRLLDAVEHARRRSRPDGPPDRPLDASPADRDAGPLALATGPRRLWYFALAGGSFAMTVVALIVPGIPTVPFLLAAGYFLARSSPALHACLRHAPVFGPILIEWEEFGGLSRSSKAGLIGLTAAIFVVSAALGASNPLALVILVVMASISIHGIARLPGLRGEAPSRVALQPGVRLALPPP